LRRAEIKSYRQEVENREGNLSACYQVNQANQNHRQDSDYGHLQGRARSTVFFDFEDAGGKPDAPCDQARLFHNVPNKYNPAAVHH